MIGSLEAPVIRDISAKAVIGLLGIEQFTPMSIPTAYLRLRSNSFFHKYAVWVIIGVITET